MVAESTAWRPVPFLAALALGTAAALARLEMVGLRFESLAPDHGFGFQEKASTSLGVIGFGLLVSLLLIGCEIGVRRVLRRPSRSSPWAALALPAAAAAWGMALIPIPPSEYQSNGGSEDALLYVVGSVFMYPAARWIAPKRDGDSWLAAADGCVLLTGLYLLLLAPFLDSYRGGEPTDELTWRAVAVGGVLSAAGFLFSRLRRAKSL